MGKIYEANKVSERIESIAIESGGGSVITYSQTLFDPKYKLATMVGCTLSILQQLSGINAVMFYSSKIFSEIGWDPRTGSALVGFVNMAATFVAVFLLGSN